MHYRPSTVVWWFRRLLGPVVVALLCGAPTARAETPRPKSEIRSPRAAAGWWGPLQLGRSRVATRAVVRPPAASPAVLRVGQGPRRSAAAPPATRPATPPAVPPASRQAGQGARLGQACRTDANCVDSGTICEKRRCVRIRRTINVMWLFYRSADRRYTSVLGLYHHRKGTPGAHILAPFYFHVWSKLSDTRVVLPPLFVQHKNHTRKSTDTFVLNFHHHRSAEAVGFNIWPLLFVKKYREKRRFSFSLIPLLHHALPRRA